MSEPYRTSLKYENEEAELVYQIQEIVKESSRLLSDKSILDVLNLIYLTFAKSIAEKELISNI